MALNDLVAKRMQIFAGKPPGGAEEILDVPDAKGAQKEPARLERRFAGTQSETTKLERS